MTWARVRLQDLGTWYGGGTPSKSSPDFWTNGDVPWLSPKDMGPEVLTSTTDHVSRSAIGGSSTRLVPPGSVAVVTRSGILERTIPVAIVPFATTMNQDMKAVVPYEGIDARWIAWGLRAHERELLRKARKAGTTVASIEMPRFYSFQLPLPELDEQRRIVAILEDHLSRLDAADAGLATARARLAAFDKACLEKHFGANGPTVALGELVTDIRAGKSFGDATAPAREDEWGIIKVSAMTWGQFRPEQNKTVASDRVDERYEIREGDLLVSRANTSDYVGASVLVGEVRPKLLLSDKSLRLTPREGVDPRWLWRALQTPSARHQISALATGTKDSMRNISQSSLRMVKLPKLSPRDQALELESYESLTMSVAAARSAVTAQRRRSAALRRALLAAAFSGRLTESSAALSDVEEMIGA